jgi:hypothetical protein
MHLFHKHVEPYMFPCISLSDFPFVTSISFIRVNPFYNGKETKQDGGG